MSADAEDFIRSLNANTQAVRDLKDEVKRLVDVFAKVITAGPTKQVDGTTVDVGEIAGRAIASGLEGLLGRRKKR